MKLSNLSVVLATSIIVDSNSTSEDISNYFPHTLVSQNDDKLENLGLGFQGNKSGKKFCHMMSGRDNVLLFRPECPLYLGW